MTYHVHAVEQDLAGRWYARVVLTADEATFLKFDDFPSMSEIQDVAAAFVAANRPELLRPAAETIGQEWTAPDGTLWRVVQARDEDSGQFLGDDPSTTDRESLAWVEVNDAAAE